MYIHVADTGLLRVGPEVERGAPRRTVLTEKSPRPAGEDRVEFSGAARSLAKQYASDGLSPQRIGHLRQQVEAGIYPHPEVMEELAWRLIEAGIV